MPLDLALWRAHRDGGGLHHEVQRAQRQIEGVHALEEPVVRSAVLPDAGLIQFQLEEGAQQQQIAQLPGEVQQTRILGLNFLRRVRVGLV